MASTNVSTFQAIHDAFNRRDFDAVLQVLSDECVYQDHARNVSFRGRDGFREFMQGWVTAFSNAAVTEPRYVDGDNVVVSEFRGRGIHDGTLGTFAKTDRALDMPFCEVLRFNDKGQITSGGIYYDQLTLLSQLGLAQQPAATAV